MNYTTLQAAVVSYLHRTSASMDTNVPMFIDSARLRLGGELRALCNFTTGSVTSFSNGLSSLPTNLAELVGVSIDGAPLQEMTYEQLQMFGSTSSLYAVAGSDLFIPAAGATTIADLTYYSIPAALVSGSDISEGMVEFPQLWIYAAVIEGLLWSRDFEAAAAFDSQYQTILQIANRSGDEARYAAPATTSEQLMIFSQSTL